MFVQSQHLHPSALAIPMVVRSSPPYIPLAPGGCHSGRVLVNKFGSMMSSLVSSSTLSIGLLLGSGGGGLISVDFSAIVFTVSMRRLKKGSSGNWAMSTLAVYLSAPCSFSYHLFYKAVLIACDAEPRSAAGFSWRLL